MISLLVFFCSYVKKNSYVKSIIKENMSKSINWSKLLKVLIAVLTAIAGSLGIVSCMA